jgi:hypothetical protein
MDTFESYSLAVGIAAVIAAGGAVIYSAWQATIARRAVEQTRIIHIDQLHPYVYADIKWSSHTRQLLSLYVCNGGPTVATNVIVEFNPILKLDPQKRGSDISSLEITALPPGASFERILGFGPRFLEANEASTIKSKIRCIGYNGETLDLEYSLDLAAIAPTSAAGKTMSEVGESLDKIAKVLDRIQRNGLGQLFDRVEAGNPLHNYLHAAIPSPGMEALAFSALLVWIVA